MSNILDNADLIEEVEAFQDKMQILSEELDNLRGETDQIVIDEDFSGEAADAFKAFFQEVHYMAIEILGMCLNDANHMMNKLINESRVTDSSENARIDEDYLDEIKQFELIPFKEDIRSYHNDIKLQVNQCNSLNLRSSIPQVFVGDIEESVDNVSVFLDKVISEVELLSNTDFSSDLNADLDRLTQVVEYLTNIATIKGVSAYKAGDVKRQDWYDDVSDTLEEYREELLKELEKNLNEEYQNGLIDYITWENAKYLLEEYGLSFGIALLTKGLMKKASVLIGQLIPQWLAQNTRLFMNRGLVAALAGGGNYLITEAPSFFTSLARGAVKYGTPVVYGIFEFIRLRANGQDTVEAGVKAVGHTAAVMGGMAVGAKVGAIVGSAIPIPVVGTAVGMLVGGAIGAVGSMAFDWIYDNRERIAEAVGNVVETVKDTVSNVVEGVGNAVSGFFSGVASIFS